MLLHSILPPSYREPKEFARLLSPAVQIVLAADGQHAVAMLADNRVWLHLGIYGLHLPAVPGRLLTAAVRDVASSSAVAVTDQGVFLLSQHDSQPQHVGALPDGKLWTCSPDGDWLAGEVCGKLALLFVPDATIRNRLALPGPLLQIAFARQGSALVGLCKTGAILGWDPRSGKRLFAIKLPGARLLAVSSDGRTIAAVVGNAKLVVMDAPSGKLRRTIPCSGASQVSSVGVSEDAEQIVAVGPVKIGRKVMRVVRTFDVPSGEEYAPLQVHAGQVTAAALGQRSLLTSGADGRLGEWEWSVTRDHLRFRKDIKGDLAVGYRRGLRDLLTREKNGLRMTDIWGFSHGDFSKQYDFELSNSASATWYEIHTGRTEPRNLVLKPKQPGKLYDVCGLWCAAGLVVSQKVVDVLNANAVTGWRGFPVTLKLPGKEKPPCRYYGLIATGRIGPLQRQFWKSDIDMTTFVDVRHWDGSDIFSPEKNCEILMTARVLDILTQAGVTGWEGTRLQGKSWDECETRQAPLPQKAAKPPVTSAAKPALPKLAPAKAISRDALKGLAKQRQLGKLADSMTAAALNSMRFNLEPAKPGTLAIGATRFGGEPDLPANVAWPVHKRKPQMFLGQLQLSDFKPFDRDNALPAAGLLSLFMLPEGAGESMWIVLGDSAWAAIYTPPGVPLARRAFPKELPSTQELEPHGLILAPTLTLPPTECWRTERWGLKGEARDAYYEMRDDLADAQWRKGPNHRLLGWPTPQLQGDVFREIAHGARKASGPKDPADWVMLLQLDSDPRLGMMWGDEGLAYFGIPAADLAKRDFSRVWCISQSG